MLELVDYKQDTYIWGWVLMSLKLGKSLLLAGHELRLEIQIFTSLILVWMYQTFIRMMKPHKSNDHNNLEIYTPNLLILNIIIIKSLFIDIQDSMIGPILKIVGLVANLLFILIVMIKIIFLSRLKSNRLEDSLFDTITSDYEELLKSKIALGTF